MGELKTEVWALQGQVTKMQRPQMISPPAAPADPPAQSPQPANPNTISLRLDDFLALSNSQQSRVQQNSLPNQGPPMQPFPGMNPVPPAHNSFPTPNSSSTTSTALDDEGFVESLLYGGPEAKFAVVGDSCFCTICSLCGATKENTTASQIHNS